MSAALVVFILAFEMGLLAGVQVAYCSRKHRARAARREAVPVFQPLGIEPRVRCATPTTKTRALEVGR